jgi:hypothetical protein
MPNGPDIDDETAPEQAAIADQLNRERPVPNAGFRGALGRHLAAADPGYGPRPAGLRPIVACYLGGGATLIALGALTAVGAL